MQRVLNLNIFPVIKAPEIRVELQRYNFSTIVINCAISANFRARLSHETRDETKKLLVSSRTNNICSCLQPRSLVLETRPFEDINHFCKISLYLFRSMYI